MKTALILSGGWEGHEPVKVANLFREILTAEGFEAEISESLEPLGDAEKLKRLSLIVPVWSMGKITKEQEQTVAEAVAGGVGLAGAHGGMCDAFREATLWQFMTGGQWVAHPGNDGVGYRVTITNNSSPITEGIEDFAVKSEQYYLHVDPAIEVLATTRFPVAEGPHTVNGPVEMPVVWTKRWGKGRVFYSSLGHHADIIDHGPAREILRRGLLWAQGKEA